MRSEAKTLKTQINQLVTATAPELLHLFGVGPNSAAALLITAGDNPDDYIPKRPSPPSAGQSRPSIIGQKQPDINSTEAETAAPTPHSTASS